MGKGKRQQKTTGSWRAFLKGNGVALVIYLAGTLLLTFMAVKGFVPEGTVFPIIAVFCMISAWSGGTVAIRKTTMGSVPAALVNTVCFVLILLVAGMGCWQDGVSWNGRGGILLLCAAIGGTASGLMGGRHSRRRKRKYSL